MQTPFELPDDCLIEIGRVIVAWNQLESVLNICLVNLLSKALTGGFDNGTDNANGHIVFAHIGTPQKLQALRSLLMATMKDDNHPLVKAFDKKIKPPIEKAMARRNQIVHSTWVSSGKKVMRINLSARGKLKVEADDLTAAEIESARKQIQQACNALYEHLYFADEIQPAKRTKAKLVATALQAVALGDKPIHASKLRKRV